MLVGRQGTGSKKVHLAGAVPPLWVFSCLCHFPQSSPVFPVPPDTASLGMKLSKSGCSLAGASAPRCPRAVGSRQTPGRTCLVGQVSSSKPPLLPESCRSCWDPPVLFRPARPDFLHGENRIRAEGEGSGACLRLILTRR